MSPAGDLNDEGDEAWGYGLLQNDLARSWEARFGAVLASTHPEADRNARALPSLAAGNIPDTAAETLPLVSWSIEQLARDQELRRIQAPKVEAKAEALATTAGDDGVALQVLGVLFLAAGIPMPGALAARVLDAIDREIAYDRAEEEASGWDHWSKRVGILRAVRALIEKDDAGPIYAGDETMSTLCDNRDLDGFLLTSMQPDITGLSRPVSVRACGYDEVADINSNPPATLVVLMGEPPAIYSRYALVTVDEPVRQVFGSALSIDDLDRVARWIALNRTILLDHWFSRNDSFDLFEACRKLA